MIIAIDGPAASGKGTLARRLATHLGFAYLDTGSLYRLVGLKLLRRQQSGEDEAAAAMAAKALVVDELNDPAIRSDDAAAMASRVAAYAAVRAALLDFQRNFAHHPPNDAAGAVLDGRDIGTTVCPDATVKIFVTADIEVRARRRFDELSGAGHDIDFETVLADMKVRDARDSGRVTAPLRQAEDAHLLDTTNSDIDSVFQAALALVVDKIARK